MSETRTPHRSWTLTSVPAPNGWPWPFLVGDALGAAAWLQTLHFPTDARLGVIGANQPAFVALLQAIPACGLTLVVLHPKLDASALRTHAAESALDAVLMDDVGFALSVPSVPLSTHWPSDRPHTSVTTAQDTAERPALVLNTSGSTGEPKAVRLSLRALRAAGQSSAAMLALRPGDHWLCCLPLAYIGGIGVVLRCAQSGATLTLHERFDAEAVTAAIDHAAITHVSLVPTMLHRLLAVRGMRPWPVTLRTILLGGDAADAALIAQCRILGLAPVITYALSEAAGTVCCDGVAVPGMSLHVSDDGVRVRGPQTFSGYERGGALITTHDAAEWFLTPDLGQLIDGRLTINGRRDTMIISGGEKIAPAVVEAALRAHPAIAEAVVCGVRDAAWGHVVAAVLVARGATPSDDAFATWLEHALPPSQRLRRWRWLESLPLTTNGKPDRRKCCDVLNGASFS